MISKYCASELFDAVVVAGRFDVEHVVDRRRHVDDMVELRPGSRIGFDAVRSAREMTAARGMLNDTLRDTLIGDAERAPFPTILDEAVAYLREVAETLPQDP